MLKLPPSWTTAGGEPAGCYATSTSCTGCNTDQLCVTAGGKATCAKPFTPLPLSEVPYGVGLFPSLAFKGKDAFIAGAVGSMAIASLFALDGLDSRIAYEYLPGRTARQVLATL